MLDSAEEMHDDLQRPAPDPPDARPRVRRVSGPAPGRASRPARRSPARPRSPARCSTPRSPGSRRRLNPVTARAAAPPSERARGAPRDAAGRGPARGLAAVRAATCSCAATRGHARRAAADRGRRRAPGARRWRSRRRAASTSSATTTAATTCARSPLAQRWPPRPGAGCLPRVALFLADRAHALEARSRRRVPAHRHARRTSPRTSRRARRDRRLTAGLLAIEGAHALDDDPRERSTRRRGPGRPDDLARALLRHGVRRLGARCRARAG